MVDLHIDYSHYIMVCIHLPHEITKWWFQTFVIFTKKWGRFPPILTSAYFSNGLVEVNHQLEKHQEILQLSVSRGGRAELAVTPAGQYNAMVAAETQVGIVVGGSQLGFRWVS